MGAGYVIINPLSVSEITLIIKNSVVSLQILAPNWHRAERKKITQCVILAKESDCRDGKKQVNQKFSVVLSP
jgi:hypothetical protein